MYCGLPRELNYFYVVQEVEEKFSFVRNIASLLQQHFKLLNEFSSRGFN